jgi:hypothetical protein
MSVDQDKVEQLLPEISAAVQAILDRNGVDGTLSVIGVSGPERHDGNERLLAKLKQAAQADGNLGGFCIMCCEVHGSSGCRSWRRCCI